MLYGVYMAYAEFATAFLAVLLGYFYAYFVYNYFEQFKIPELKEKALFYISQSKDPRVTKRIYETHIAVWRVFARFLEIVVPAGPLLLAAFTTSLWSVFLFMFSIGCYFGLFLTMYIAYMHDYIDTWDLTRWGIGLSEKEKKKEEGKITIEEWTPRAVPASG